MLIMVGAGGVFWWAWRGRVVDGHPICRWCGFDLTGKEEDSPLCPECWNGVSRAYGVRTSGVVYGHREVRGWWAAFSGLLFVGTFLISFVAVIVEASGSSLYGQYPVSFVMASVTQGADADRSAAVYELTQRMRTGAIKKGDLDPLWDRLLLMQVERTEPWRGMYGDLLVAGRQYLDIDDARWKRYIDELTRCAMEDSPVAARAAVAELRLRALSTCMAKGELDPIVDFILAKQGDAREEWWTGWGDLVESARSVAVVDDVRWQRFVIQGIRTTARFEPEILQGDGWVKFTTETTLRLGSSPQTPMAFMTTSLELTAGDVTVLLPMAERRTLRDLKPYPPLQQKILVPKSDIAKFPGGPVTATVSQIFEFVPQPRFSKRTEAQDIRKATGTSTLVPDPLSK